MLDICYVDIYKYIETRGRPYKSMNNSVGVS